MSAAPRIHTIPPTSDIHRHTDHEQQIQFFRAIWGVVTGWVELCYAVADPATPSKLIMHRDGWYKYTPAHAPQIARRVQQLAQRHGNVYTSWACYRTKKRDKAAALPGPSIFLDDAPISRYTFTVQTGRDSRHGWLLLNQPFDVATRERIARQAAYAAGADRSGWDITQLVRVPGSWNTKPKHGGRFAVCMEPGTSATYTLSELEERWPASDEPNPLTCNNWRDSIDWTGVEQHLGNLSAILKRIKPHTRTYEQLHSDGGPDRSRTRWGVAMELRKRFGYPDEEIAAILITHCDYGHSDEKGTDALYADVARCIADANRLYPDAFTSRSRCYETRPAQPLPQKSAPRRGRPRSSSPELHLTWLLEHVDASNTVLQSQPEIAAARGVSLGTVRRDEQALQKHGQIQRVTVRRGRRTSSHVVILSAIKNTSAGAIKKIGTESHKKCIAKPQNECKNSTIGETHAGGGLPLPDPVPDSSSAESVRISPAAAMRAAFAAVAADGRVTRKRIRACLEHYISGYRWHPDVFERMYLAEQERRRQAQQDAKLAAELEELDNRGILRAVRSCERHIATSQEQRTRHYRYWLVRRRMLMAEIRRRRPDLERDDQRALIQFAEHLKVGRRRQQRITAQTKALQQPSLFLNTSALPNATIAPEGQQGGGVCSSQPNTGAVSARDEVQASIARDLLSWGKLRNAQAAAREIGNSAVRARVEAEIAARGLQ